MLDWFWTYSGVCRGSQSKFICSNNGPNLRSWGRWHCFETHNRVIPLQEWPYRICACSQRKDAKPSIASMRAESGFYVCWSWLDCTRKLSCQNYCIFQSTSTLAQIRSYWMPCISHQHNSSCWSQGADAVPQPRFTSLVQMAAHRDKMQDHEKHNAFKLSLRESHPLSRRRSAEDIEKYLWFQFHPSSICYAKSDI